MENDINVKGVSIKELFVNCIWKSDTYKTVSKETSKKSSKVVSAKVSKIKYKEEPEIDKEWKTVLEKIDKKEKIVRIGSQISSKSGARRTGKTNPLKKMQVENSPERKEPAIKQEQENSDKEIGA